MTECVKLLGSIHANPEGKGVFDGESSGFFSVTIMTIESDFLTVFVGSNMFWRISEVPQIISEICVGGASVDFSPFHCDSSCTMGASDQQSCL
jgi:hypothetical protein